MKRIKSARLWTENAQAKILKNREYTGKSEQTLRIAAAKNEYRGAQIQVFALQNIRRFDVRAGDLTNGSEKIDKSEISVFVEKHTKIVRKSNSIGEFLPGDEIPDALIPLAAVRKKGEDKIRKGENQGFYLDIRVREEVKAGIYRGFAEVVLNGAAVNLPIELTVYDFAVPSITPVMNYWGMFDRTESMLNELDTSDEMAQAYFETMLQYRINSELLPFSGIGGTKRYVNLLRKYYFHYGFSTYRLPNSYKECEYGGERIDFDAEELKEYVAAIARASAEDKVDYLAKAFVYFVGSRGIDEPQTEESYRKCQIFSKVYGQIREDVNAELKRELQGGEYSFYVETVEKTVLSLPAVLTLCNQKQYWEIQNYDVHNFTYCLVAHGWDFPRVRRSMFSQSAENWIYTCTGPVYPYPSAHIDDYAVSLRLIGWMMKAYDIKGYLNWGAAINRRSEYPYTQPDIGFSNGDGWIFYAGRYYGIRGPVPSLRAVAFRDGMQDYCWLDLAEKQLQKGGTEKLPGEMYDELFNNTRVLVKDSSLLETFRGKLAEMIAGGGVSFGFSGEGEKVTVDDCTDSARTVVRVNSTYQPAIEINTDARFSEKGASLKINLQGRKGEGNYYPRIFIDAQHINSGNYSEVKNITFRIYGTQELTAFSVYGLDEVNKTLLYETEIEKGWNTITVPICWQQDKAMKIILLETDNFYDEKGPRAFYLDEVSILCISQPKEQKTAARRRKKNGLADVTIPWGCTCFGKLSLSEEKAEGGGRLKIEVMGCGTMRPPASEVPKFTVAAPVASADCGSVKFVMYNADPVEREIAFYAVSENDTESEGVRIGLKRGRNEIKIAAGDLKIGFKQIKAFGFRFQKYSEIKEIQVYYLEELKIIKKRKGGNKNSRKGLL